MAMGFKGDKKTILLTFMTANFPSLMINHEILDGSAMNGQVTNGNHMLGDRGDTTTEVSKDTYIHLYTHQIILFISWPIGLLKLAEKKETPTV